MKVLFYFIPLILCNLTIHAHEETLWSRRYQKVLIKQARKMAPTLSTYPSTKYPNSDYQQVVKKYPNGTIPLFGYGSLINAKSAAHSVSQKAIQSMRPVVAFRYKRIFNYVEEDLSEWGPGLAKNERAMLNIEPTTTYDHMINGIVMEISREDLIKLIERETGYDLVPILIADWNEVIRENPTVPISIAYTFSVPGRSRTRCYPIREYLRTVRDGVALFGEKFLNYWNSTTYLGDRTTTMTRWSEQTKEKPMTPGSY